ncbi:MAG: IS110 family transposase [Anaerolineae bacterium]|nr:IS110 family transposase [Anaerolineae bacterium]
MRVMYEQVAGLDIHKKTVVACRMRVTGDRRIEWEKRTFGTMMADLLGLYDWLSEWEIEQVALESTADYWKPIFNILEDGFEVVLVNAQHVKKVPGRKTDASDAEWLAELMLHGLLKASFIPAKPQRELRELTRYRTTVVRERARIINRVEKLLESTNIKLSSVVTDVMGVSAKAMLTELAAGASDPQALAELAKGRLRNKIKELETALSGTVSPNQLFILAQQLSHIDFLDEQIEAFNQQISHQLQHMVALSVPDDDDNGNGSSAQDQVERLSWTEAVERLDTIPGVDQRTAEIILAEIGLDMGQFPTADDLASWAGFAPGNYQSGGKRYSGRTTKGNRPIGAAINQAAWAASRTKGTWFKARYHRLAARRGKKRAIVAIGRSMLVAIWHMLARNEPYRDLGPDFYDQRRKDTKVAYFTKQLSKLGFVVSLDPLPSAA